MIFTVAQVRSIREGKTTAALVLVSERIRTGSLRLLRRRIPASDDGERPERVETVTEETDGERFAVAFTVLAVRDVGIESLSFAEARACGYRTPAAMRDGWHARHPRIELVRFVRFELGDLRDVPRLISVGWPDYTSDPSRAMRGEPEAISQADTAWYGSDSYQRHAARRMAQQRKLEARSAAERLAAIERHR